jgi:hypothetical protein
LVIIRAEAGLFYEKKKKNLAVVRILKKNSLNLPASSQETLSVQELRTARKKIWEEAVLLQAGKTKKQEAKKQLQNTTTTTLLTTSTT